MIEVDLQWLKGTQFFDSNGDPLSGGKLFIQDAGTTNFRTTYSDATGSTPNTYTSNQIILDSAGRLSESVYIPVGSWKVRVNNSSDVTVTTEDNIEGALDTSVFATGTVAWSLPVLSKTSNYTVVADDLGKCINANPTGGSFTVTLISAATAGDGKTLCVRHVGPSNQVTIATVSSQTIDGYDTFVLSNQYESVLLVSDGANWHITAQSTPTGFLQFLVADRLITPPANPTPGAWYIINGTPANDWANFAQHDIVRAAGDGGWHKFTPPADSGWMAFVQDENVLTQFRDSAWVDLSNVTAPNTDEISVAVLAHQEASGVQGGTATSGARETRTLNTKVSDPDSIATLSSNQFTLQSGNYLILSTAQFFRTGSSKTWLRNVTDGTDAGVGPNAFSLTTAAGGNNTASVIQAFVSLSAQKTFEIQSQVGSTAATNGWGSASSLGTESYLTVTIIKLDTLQGPRGEQGLSGNAAPSYVPGRYHTGLYVPSSSTMTVIANRLYFLPFEIRSKETWTEIGIEVTTASAGNARLGIFRIDMATGEPGDLVLDAGTVDTGTTGLKPADPISQELDTGFYARGVVFNATPAVRRGNTDAPWWAGAASPSLFGASTYKVFTFGALPSSAAGSIIYTGGFGIPMVWLRIVP